MDTLASPLVFCDFDGTITVQETFVGMLERFTPQLWSTLKPDIYSLQLSLKNGVRQLLESIPSQRYPEILEYMSTQPLTPGFPEFLEFLDHHDIPIVIVSGGLQDMVETALGSLVQQVRAIHAAHVNTDSPYLKALSEFEGDTELVAKVDVMNHYGSETTIAIGDGVTDLNMALHASLVFAKSSLARYLDDRKHSYIPWTTFFDVRDELARRWLETVDRSTPLHGQ